MAHERHDMPPRFHMRLEGQDEVTEHLDIMRSWFKRSDMSEELNRQVQSTLKWLRENKHRYAAPYFDMQQKPWWSELQATADPVQLEIRNMGLRYMIYEHGLINFIKGLELSGLLGEVPHEALKFAVDGNIRAALEQLIILAVKDSANQEQNLKSIAERFGLSANTKTAKFRDCGLVRLTSLGLLIGRYDGENYGIRIGPVAFEFYSNVYVPMVSEMQHKIHGAAQ